MIVKFTKIIFFITSFIFLTGFVQIASLLGPGVTIFSSGNVYKAGAQFLIDNEIKRKTGKNSLALVKEEMEKQNDKKNFNEEFNLLIEKRVAKTQKIITEQNNQKKLKEEFKKLIEKRIAMVQKELNLKKVSQ